MANSIQKWSADDVMTLQVTRPARERAGLVDEDSDGNPIHLADVFVYVFDDVLLVIDTEVSAEQRAQLVALASRQTGSIYGGQRTSITTAGGGYKVHLPGCSEGGFEQGRTAPVKTARGIMAIHRDDRGRDVAEQLVENRRQQTDGGQSVSLEAEADSPA